MTNLTAIAIADVVADLRDELDDTDPSEWTAWEAPYEGATVSNQCYQIVHHAEAQRGGIVFVGSGSSGLTSWTDAATPDEVYDRHLADDMRP